MPIVPFVQGTKRHHNLIARGDRSGGRALALVSVGETRGPDVIAAWLELQSYRTSDLETEPEEVFRFGSGELPTLIEWLQRLQYELEALR